MVAMAPLGPALRSELPFWARDMAPGPMAAVEKMRVVALALEELWGLGLHSGAPQCFLAVLLQAVLWLAPPLALGHRSAAPFWEAATVLAHKQLRRNP